VDHDAVPLVVLFHSLGEDDVLLVGHTLLLPYKARCSA
jgi:hypothetical protein